MKITVINGSPKGEYSITLQTIHYLTRLYPQHSFQIVHAGQRIKALEKDFTPARKRLEEADLILFAYPVYTFLAPSQLHRFIELMKYHHVKVQDKYVSQITTSKHFYDITAHKYIEENVLDLHMRYIQGLSADMEDLLQEQGRKDARQFFDRVLWSIEERIFTYKEGNEPKFYGMPVSAIESVKPKKKWKDILILTDNEDSHSNLAYMIRYFQSVLPYQTRIINLSEYPFAGGCLGCFRCAVSEKCVYRDGFDSFLREQIQSADAIIYAFTIKDHSMGSRFKLYDDRNFCNGHRTVTVGMPIGYLISGRYSAEHNLQTVIEARAQTGGNYLCGCASDESNTSETIEQLAKTLCYALRTRHRAPQNFWGVGGMKIFRDLIYQMRGMMRADHKFYKKQGIYNDFPQKHKLTSWKMYLVGMLLSNEKILAKMGNQMNEGMLMPYRKLFEEMDQQKGKQKS